MVNGVLTTGQDGGSFEGPVYEVLRCAVLGNPEQAFEQCSSRGSVRGATPLRKERGE